MHRPYKPSGFSKLNIPLSRDLSGWGDRIKISGCRILAKLARYLVSFVPAKGPHQAARDIVILDVAACLCLQSITGT